VLHARELAEPLFRLAAASAASGRESSSICHSISWLGSRLCASVATNGQEAVEAAPAVDGMQLA